MQALKLLGQQLSKIWAQLGLNQRVIIIVSGIGVIAALGALVYWSSRPDYALLFGRLDPSEAGRIIAELEEMKIPHRTGASGSSIYIVRDKIHSTRMQLAVKGMPKAEGVGFEIFDKPTFGMSDFMQQANYVRALQGELGRTISEFEGIDAARVMIVKPESRLLIDPNKKTTASVFVRLRGMIQLDAGTVNAIRFFVANAVEGLKPTNVSVVDNSGNVLSETEEEASLGAMSSSQLAIRRSVEKYLADKVKRMLEGVLGPDQAVVTVSAEINSETMAKTDEYYYPDAVERSKTVRTETTDTITPRPGGVAGTTTNANTTATASVGQDQSNSSRTDDTQTDYAVSMSRTNLTRIAGGISRVTASVFVNTNSNPSIDTNALKQAVVNALGIKPPVTEEGVVQTDITEVALYGISFNKEHEIELSQQLDEERQAELMWKIGRNVLYVLLALAALIGFWRLVRSSSEELLPTGIPVGQLVGGQLVYEAPTGGIGMALPTGMVSPMSEQRVEEVVAADEDVEELQAAKSKLVMDFGLGQQAPERITIEVLKQLIRENPAKMSQAARSWLARKNPESEM